MPTCAEKSARKPLLLVVFNHREAIFLTMRLVSGLFFLSLPERMMFNLSKKSTIMKRMLTVLAAAALVTVSASAQKEKNNPYYTEKWSDNIAISVGGGAQFGLRSSNYDAGFWRALNPDVYVGITKHINPLWSVRGVIGGWRSSERLPGANEVTKKYINIYGDVLYNLTNAFLGYQPDKIVEVSVFAGPYVNFLKSELDQTRPGISAGGQLRFNINKYFAIDLEARMSRQREMVYLQNDRFYLAGTVGVTYTIGGKEFQNCSKHDLCLAEQKSLNDQINANKAQISDLQNQLAASKRETQQALANANKPVASDCDMNAGPVAVFFKIGKANIDDRGQANIELAAKAIKADPNGKYTVRGYADKATGSAAINQKLSEKRAKAVYDALVAAGVDGTQLEQQGMGAQDNMFSSDALNRVVIIKRK